MNGTVDTVKKDITWSIFDNKYTVLNVPYSEYEDDAEIYLSLGVSTKLLTIKELMEANEIPHEVDFDDLAHLKF
jgi:hypothetical protein